MSDPRRMFDILVDAAIAAGKVLHDQDRLDEMKRRTIPTCGACQHWMKSRDCPAERNVNGFSRGPSMNSPPCGKFNPEADFTRAVADYQSAMKERRP